ncbi:hypothetical protein KY290_037802 [Solanum tuberosum]|uniref:Nuclease HARBI1 n=1 Tax=Solanum tuberosum TaxID=4113 RepID=A0ABQ7TYC8_SOLTU|nr:hypothetical protein KY290_037802 [Solanum tuberosum]
MIPRIVAIVVVIAVVTVVVIVDFFFQVFVVVLVASNHEFGSLIVSTVEVFGERYLRSPTPNDVARLLHIGEQRGFPGMLGSLDCMHWKWKNCPTAWTGQYASRSRSPTIILEVVADYDLWIWHAYFGLPGTNNDINVLESSHLFSNLASGIVPPAHYVIQGK